MGHRDVKMEDVIMCINKSKLSKRELKKIRGGFHIVELLHDDQDRVLIEAEIGSPMEVPIRAASEFSPKLSIRIQSDA